MSNIFDKLDTVRSFGKCFYCEEDDKILRLDWFTNGNDINNLDIRINSCLECYEKIDKEMNEDIEPEDDEWWRT